MFFWVAGNLKENAWVVEHPPVSTGVFFLVPCRSVRDRVVWTHMLPFCFRQFHPSGAWVSFQTLCRGQLPPFWELGPHTTAVMKGENRPRVSSMHVSRATVTQTLISDCVIKNGRIVSKYVVCVVLLQRHRILARA